MDRQSILEKMKEVAQRMRVAQTSKGNTINTHPLRHDEMVAKMRETLSKMTQAKKVNKEK